MHTHSDYVTALSCLKDPHILPIHQSSMRFVERVAYYQEYDVPDVIDEGKKLGEALKDKDILILASNLFTDRQIQVWVLAKGSRVW